MIIEISSKNLEHRIAETVNKSNTVQLKLFILDNSIAQCFIDKKFPTTSIEPRSRHAAEDFFQTRNIVGDSQQTFLHFP